MGPHFADDVHWADTLAKDSALIDKAAVLEYLSREVVANPPADGMGNAEFDVLVASFTASVATIPDAARAGDMQQIKAAMGSLKKPYAMPFLKFG